MIGMQMQQDFAMHLDKMKGTMPPRTCHATTNSSVATANDEKKFINLQNNKKSAVMITMMWTAMIDLKIFNLNHI